MAYVPGFQHDVFISYARENYDSRMADFVKDLRDYLRQELGRSFTEGSVFFDQQDLDRTPTAWKEHLRQSATSTAILIPLLSQSYAESDYCSKELEWFSEDSRLRWKAGPIQLYRICPVGWRNLDEATVHQLAPEIRDAQQDWSKSVEDLGAKLVNGLRLMWRTCHTVYVGETDDDVRSKLRDEMVRMGFRVMPTVPMAYRDETLVRKLLSEARMAVHFIGGQTEQRAITAIKHSRRECQGATVIYEIPGYDLGEDEKLSLAWIELDIRNTTEPDSRDYDRVKGKNLDQFLQIIQNRLEGIRPMAPTRLGVAYEEADRSAVEGIIPDIEKRTGFTITCHGLALLEFKKSRSVLFYWGTSDGMRLRQARLAARGLRQAFFLAPPPKADGLEQELAGASVFRQRGDRFSVEDIRPFLRDLGWAGS